jgi:hypothetical protein
MKTITRFGYAILMLFSLAQAAFAGYPTLSAPSTNNTGTFVLTPNAPESPFFLQDVWKREPGGNWQPFKVSYGSYPISVTAGATGLYEYKTRWYNPGAQVDYLRYSEFSNSVYVQVTIGSVPTDAPMLWSPGTSTTGNYTLNWSTVGGGESYQLEVLGGGNSWYLVSNSPALSYSAYNQSNGTYSYRVKACNSVGCGPVSSAVQVTVQIPPPIAVPAAPAYVRVVYTGVVIWASVTDATSYELQNYQSGWVTYYNGSGTGTTFGGSSVFRVRACNSFGCSGWTYN